MKSAQIICNGKVVHETDNKADAYACAKWAHFMGWDVLCYDDSKAKLDRNGKSATLRIFDQ